MYAYCVTIYKNHKTLNASTGAYEGGGGNPDSPLSRVPPKGGHPLGGRALLILHLLAFPFLRHSTFYIALQ